MANHSRPTVISASETDSASDRRRFSSPLLLLLMILILYLVLAAALPGKTMHLNQGRYETLDGLWTITLPDGQVADTHLPATFSLERNALIKADYVFDRDYNDGSVLQIRASMQQVRVLLDQTLVFSSDQSAETRFTLPQASVWHLVPLPSRLAGHTLTLEVSSPVGVMSGVVNPVVIGSANTLIWQLFIRQWPTLLMVLMLVIAALTSLALQLANRLNDGRLLYLGLFALSVAIWFFSEARLMQLITGSQLLIGSISYMMIAFIPAFFLLYLRDAVLSHFHRLLTLIAIGYLLWWPVTLGIQLVGLAHLIDMAVYVNIATIITVIMILVLLFISTIREHSRAARIMLFAFIGLGIAAISEVIAFLRSNFDATSHYSRFGIIFFFVLILVDAVRSVQHLVQADKKARMLSQLAYLDAMSGIGNRLAFDRDIEQMADRPDAVSFRLITMDINDLKAINDHFGHQAGDEAIRLFCQCLKEVFTEPDQCYRTGGDEFSVICPQTDQTLYEEKIHRLQICLSTRDEQPFRLISAIGSGLYHRENKETLHDFLNRVDQSMYQHKKKLKQHDERTAGNRPLDNERRSI